MNKSNISKIVLMTFVLMLCVTPTFAAGGFFSGIGEFFSSIFGGEDKVSENIELLPLDNLNIELEKIQLNLTKDDVSVLLNSSDAKTYLEKLEIQCYYLELNDDDQNIQKVSLKLNENYSLDNMYHEDICDDYLKVDIKLVNEIIENGFNKSKAFSYFSDVSANMGLYIKLKNLI